MVITSLPYDISSPGHYCLESDLVSQPYGINISASHVFVDCKRHSVSASSRQAGGIGIASNSGLADVTISNCLIKDFDHGIDAGYEGTDFQLLNNHIDGSMTSGIQAWGNRTRIVNNRITNAHNESGGQVAGITLLPFNPSTTASGQALINNVIAGMSGSAGVIGLDVSGSSAPQLVNNEVLQMRSNGSYAIAVFFHDWVQGAVTTNAVLTNNTLSADASNTSETAIVGNPRLCAGNIGVGHTADSFDACTTQLDNSIVQ